MTPTPTEGVVQVVSGIIREEISSSRVGRCPEARDGTYLLKASPEGWQLIPIAVEFDNRPRALLNGPLLLREDSRNVNG